MDVSSYNLLFPETGVFVGIDLLHFTDKQGQITEYLKSPNNMHISVTEIVSEARTYYQWRGKWALTGQRILHDGFPLNACFGLEAKFPAE